MTDRERGPRIFPWELSATGQWSMETGLDKLRDLPIPELVAYLDEFSYAIETGVFEILAHGNMRRAVEVSRRLVELNPKYVERFKVAFGGEDTQFYKDWFSSPLEGFPSSSGEMKRNNPSTELIQ